MRYRLIAALMGCIAAPAASAGALVIHGISWHEGMRVETNTHTEPGALVCYKGRCKQGEPTTTTTETTRHYDWANPGIGWRHQYAPTVAMQAGLYHNSYDRISVYGLVDWEPLRAGAFSAGAFVGLASGYTHGVAAGGLVLRVQGERLGIALRAMPKVSEKQSGAVAALEVTYRIGGTR